MIIDTAKYSGSALSPLSHKGLQNHVWTLAADGNDLYVGGEFVSTYDGVFSFNHVTRYSSGEVRSVFPGNGLNKRVLALAVTPTDVYVGGTSASRTEIPQLMSTPFSLNSSWARHRV